jgi:hypothetical protein
MIFFPYDAFNCVFIFLLIQLSTLCSSNNFLPPDVYHSIDIKLLNHSIDLSTMPVTARSKQLASSTTNTDLQCLERSLISTTTVSDSIGAFIPVPSTSTSMAYLPTFDESYAFGSWLLQYPEDSS